MPPKRSTRSSTRASQKSNGDSKESSAGAGKQATLEETGEGVIDHKTGEKRTTPPDDKELVSADDKKDGTRANKKQKQEAAEKNKDINGGADEIDEKSEKAKAKGREIMDDNNVEMKKPSRGTLEKGTVYFWYKPKGELVPLLPHHHREAILRRVPASCWIV